MGLSQKNFYPKMNKKVNDRNVDKSMFLSFQFPVILQLIERGRDNLYREVPDITLTPS